MEGKHITPEKSSAYRRRWAADALLLRRPIPVAPAIRTPPRKFRASRDASELVLNGTHAPSPPEKVSWAYGVTTVPERREDQLPRTLDYLRRGGFDSPRLFVDGCGHSLARTYEDTFRLPVTARYPRVLVVANWTLALVELYARNPNADRYAVFQDDLRCVRNLRAYLESISYPTKGYLNLYTFRESEAVTLHRHAGFHETPGTASRQEPGRWQHGRGAVALVFSQEAVRALLTAPNLVMKPKDVDGWRRVDGMIVAAMNLQGYREYAHNPSLVQHTGLRSSIRPENDGQSLAKSYPGDAFDALSLLPQGARHGSEAEV
jgi:hypothetical protein